MLKLKSLIKSLRYQLARIMLLFSIYGYYKKGRHYEPVIISGKLIQGSKRDWIDRWDGIKGIIKEYNATTLMDIGCAEGFFLKKASKELGCISLGVEMNDNRLILGEMTRLYENIENCAVIKAKLDPLSIKKLPKMDVILCLSVVHHIIKSDGMERAISFVSALAGRTNKAIVFEMGTSDEISFVGRMPSMPQGQELFIRKFLEDSGFKNIRVINKSKSIKKDSIRLMFVAEPSLGL